MLHISGSFIVHMCKMIVFSGLFFSFSKFLFSRLLGGVKRQKMVQNDKKNCLSRSGTIHHMIVIYGTHV